MPGWGARGRELPGEDAECLDGDAGTESGLQFHSIDWHGHLRARFSDKGVAIIVKRAVESADLDSVRLSSQSRRSSLAAEAAVGGASERSRCHLSDRLSSAVRIHGSKDRSDQDRGGHSRGQLGNKWGDGHRARSQIPIGAGPTAPSETASWADAMLSESDLDGYTPWNRVPQVVRELLSREPAGPLY